MDFSILRDASGTAFSTDVLSNAITTGLSIANATLTSGVEITSTPQLSTTSTVMTHEEHNLTFIPGGPAGTVAINGTHHTTSTGDVIEAINSTHHIASDGLVTSHVEANLTREFHGLTDEHLDDHTAAGTTPAVLHLFHPELLYSDDDGSFDGSFDDIAPVVTVFATVALNDTHHLAWDGDVVEYVNETHHIAHDTDVDVVIMTITASVVLDIALESIAAGSSERAAFEDAFMSDMASALGIAEDRVRLLLA